MRRILTGLMIGLAALGPPEGWAAEAVAGWAAVQAAKAAVQPEVEAGKHREAASAWYQLRQRTRDPDVKDYARYAYDICKLSDKLARGRPGRAWVALDFDDGTVPESFRDGRENLVAETAVTFAGSPGALRIRPPDHGAFLLAESYSPFTVEKECLLSVCVYVHHVAEAKFQLNTERGSVHYFWKQPLKDDDWNVLIFRVAMDGSALVPVGTQVRAIAFVGSVAAADGFVILDEWRVVGYP